MTQVVETETILDSCPAEVQVYFETRFHVYGVEAQISRMLAKRKLTAPGLKKQKQKLQASNSDIRLKLSEGEAISEESAQSFKANLDKISGLNKRINNQYKRHGVGRSDVRVYKDAAEIYESDALQLATKITGKQVEPMEKLDPSILKRIEELRKAKRDAAKANR